MMNTFIQFVTGSPKITVFNSNFNITIEKVYDVNCLPVAHTWYLLLYSVSTPLIFPNIQLVRFCRRSWSLPSAKVTTVSESYDRQYWSIYTMIIHMSNIKSHHSDWYGIFFKLRSTGSVYALRSRMNWLMLFSVDFFDCSLRGRAFIRKYIHH